MDEPFDWLDFVDFADDVLTEARLGVAWSVPGLLVFNGLNTLFDDMESIVVSGFEIGK